MKKRMLRNISLVTAAVLIATSMTIPTFADEEGSVIDETGYEALEEADFAEEEAVVGVVPFDISNLETGTIDADGNPFYGVKKGPETTYGNMEGGIEEECTGGDVTELPESYYSPSENRTQVFNQAYYGTCWTFGTLGAVEASALKNIEGLELSGKDMELSRIHLAYYTYMADPKDTLGGLTGDSNRIDKRKGNVSKDFMNEGGLPAQQITTLMNWKGAADGKTVMPYSDSITAYEEAYKDGVIPHCESLIKKYKSKINAYLTDNEFTDGRVPLSDDGNRFWINMLDPRDRYEGMSDEKYYNTFMAVIRNIIEIKDAPSFSYVYSVTPTPTDATAWNDLYHVTGAKIVNDASTEENRNAVKALIRDYGSASFTYYEGNETNMSPEQQRGEFYSVSNNCYYLYTDIQGYEEDENENPDHDKPIKYHTNHCIQVVGWDDNFSKDKFNVEPEGDGAWIVKNSWMDTEENEDAWCHEGLFYISYYDKMFSNVIAYDVEDAKTTDNNYQYDGAAYSKEYSNDGTTLKAANVFKASASDGELLKRVAFSTAQSEQDVTVSIYKNMVYGNNPESGIKVSETKTHLDYPGYRYVDLDKPVVLKKGEKYAVVITLERETEPSIDLELNVAESVAKLKAGQSYIFNEANGRWTDCRTMSRRLKTGNLRIKAFTDNIDEADLGRYTASGDSVPMREKLNAKGKVTGRIVDADAVSANSVITVNAGTKFSIKSFTDAEVSEFAILDDSTATEPLSEGVRKTAAGQVSKTGVVRAKAIKKNGSYSMTIGFKQGEEEKKLVVKIENIGFDRAIKSVAVNEAKTVGLSQLTDAGYVGDASAIQEIKWTVNAGKNNKLAAVEVSDDNRLVTITPKESVRGKVKISAVINGKKYSTYVKVDTK